MSSFQRSLGDPSVSSLLREANQPQNFCDIKIKLLELKELPNIWFQPAALQKEKPSISSRSCVCICRPKKAFTLQSTLKNTQPKHLLSAKGNLPLHCKGLLPAGKCFVNKCIYIKHINPKEGAECEMGQRWWPRFMDKHPAPGKVSPAQGKSSPGHTVAHTV